jgi:CheY-like chemotaxis protein
VDTPPQGFTARSAPAPEGGGGLIVNDIARFLGIAVQMLGVLAWPVVLLLLALRFRDPITVFLKNISQLRVSAFGVEASVASGREQAVAALGAAVEKQASGRGGSADGEDLKAITAALPTPSAQQRLQHSRVLWVDDRPDNNRLERQALEALGIWVEISTSTEDALIRTRAASYQLIISDMTRDPDPQAGYTLLGKLRERGDQTPFIIYAGSSSPEQTATARARGAVDYLSQPAALMGLATRLLAY